MIKFLLTIVSFALILGCNDSKKAGEETLEQGKDSVKTQNNEIDMTAIEKLIPKGDDSVTVAIIKTKFGNIEIELFTDDAPKTTRNFVGLSLMNYYNNVIFHRVVKGFVLQGGDPTGTGAGGTSIYGDFFEDELNPNTQSYKEGYQRGVVAMANKGPNTNSSQFFIVLEQARQLPKNYTIFGKVVKGMNVVDKIAAQKNEAGGDRPVEPVAMESVTIEKRFRNLQSIFDKK